MERIRGLKTVIELLINTLYDYEANFHIHVADALVERSEHALAISELKMPDATNVTISINEQIARAEELRERLDALKQTYPDEPITFNLINERFVWAVFIEHISINSIPDRTEVHLFDKKTTAVAFMNLSNADAYAGEADSFTFVKPMLINSGNKINT